MRPARGAVPGIIAALSVVATTAMVSGRAQAAGAAYAVDTSEVSATGSCKVESWASWASNRDFIGVVNPSCVVDVGRPVEFSAQIYRFRADEEWGSGIAPKAKTKIIPSAIGSFGLADGALEVTPATQPRFQTGLRIRPIDVFSIDFVYGRNIYGENANWFTVAATIRFPPPGGKAGE